MEEKIHYKNSFKIICLTEESVETLFEIEAGDSIIGVSAFVKRPDAALSLPKVSFFTTSNIDKICKMKPDLILGFSDIQKDIARDLIERGMDVWISNHRSIEGIKNYIYRLSLLVDKKDNGLKLLDKINQKIEEAILFCKSLEVKPKVYFEEWDEPLISSIQWVSELIELCGGENIFHEKSVGVLAKDRFVTHDDIISLNPDIIIACHCGKKVKLDKIKSRRKYDEIAAVKSNQVFEVEPEIFLQPGPAVLTDGIDIILDIFGKWRNLK